MTDPSNPVEKPAHPVVREMMTHGVFSDPRTTPRGTSPPKTTPTVTDGPNMAGWRERRRRAARCWLAATLGVLALVAVAPLTPLIRFVCASGCLAAACVHVHALWELRD